MVRPEEADDAAGIFAIHAAAFPTDAEARLVDALRAAGRLAISLVAEDDGRVVGHVAFSPVSVGGATGGLGLAPLAVAPGSQRRGIGGGGVRAGGGAGGRGRGGVVGGPGGPRAAPPR